MINGWEAVFPATIRKLPIQLSGKPLEKGRSNPAGTVWLLILLLK